MAYTELQVSVQTLNGTLTAAVLSIEVTDKMCSDQHSDNKKQPSHSYLDWFQSPKLIATVGRLSRVLQYIEYTERWPSI